MEKLNIIVLSLTVTYLNKRDLLYIILKNTFFSTSENENPELYKNGGRSAMLQIFPGGKICNERGKICNVANLPPWVKVCNVADLPREGLQCCRSSGGMVCNAANLPGWGLQGGRSAICSIGNPLL